MKSILIPPVLERPFFIVGAGRSGTTLLRSLLSAHPRLTVTPETHFMKVAARHGGLNNRPKDFELFWRHYVDTQRFKDLGVDPDRCRALMPDALHPTLRDVFAALLAAFAERASKPRVGEKTPGHSKFMPEILAAFPDALIVVVRRDPRAVVASQMKTPWTQSQIRPRSLRGGLLSRKRVHQVLFYARNWQHVYGDLVPAMLATGRVTTFDYEALASEPEAELRKICDFLGESFDPSMLQDRSAETVLQPAAADRMSAEWRDWSASHNARTLAPVTTASLENWRAELSPRDVALVEAVCAAGMRDAGHRFETDVKAQQGRRLRLVAIRAGECAELAVHRLAKRVLSGRTAAQQ